MEITQIKSVIPATVANNYRLPVSEITSTIFDKIPNLGINLTNAQVKEQIEAMNSAGFFRGRAEDAAYTPPTISPSFVTPVQFLQYWLPGFVKVLTAKRSIDDLLGITIAGNWEDAEIIQPIVEPAGIPQEYGDTTNIPLSNWSANYDVRTIVRGELGFNVGILETARTVKAKLNSADIKRVQCAIALEIMRNAIGMFGWNDTGVNQTYGFLNDPKQDPIESAPSAATGGWGGTTDGVKTFNKVETDIRYAMSTLRTKSGNQIDPQKDRMTLALPPDKIEYFNAPTDYGYSGYKWAKETYPGLRIIPVLELGGSYMGGAAPITNDLMYLFADRVENSVDGSNDDGATFMQLVQTKLKPIGVENRAKTYIEDFTNATAGTLCKRPYASVRLGGI